MYDNEWTQISVVWMIYSNFFRVANILVIITGSDGSISIILASTFVAKNPLPPLRKSFLLLDHSSDPDDVARHSFLQNAFGSREIETSGIRMERRS